MYLCIKGEKKKRADIISRNWIIILINALIACFINVWEVFICTCRIAADSYTDFELQFCSEIKYRTEITLLDEPGVRNPQSPYLGIPSFSFTSPLFSVYLSTCPFIRISPLSSATTIVHPDERGLLTHRHDASITANASCTRIQPHLHYSTFGFLPANKRPWGFGSSWYLRAEVKYVPFVPSRLGITERDANVVPSFSTLPMSVRKSDRISRYSLMRRSSCRKKGFPDFQGRKTMAASRRQ